MTTAPDTTIVPPMRYEARHSNGWSMSVMPFDYPSAPRAIVIEAHRLIDGMLVRQEIRLPLDAAQALASALDDLLYAPRSEDAA